MATTLDTYAPYDSGPGSNISEATWRRFMKHVLGDGPLRSVTDGFEVFADSTGMQVKVKTGECWIQGHWGENASQKTLAIAAAHATLARIDRVVLRNDFVNNRIELDVKTGTAAASPVAPTLTQNSSAWEISLATVSVPATDVSIDAAQVTDARVWTETTAPASVTDIQNASGTTTAGIYTSALSGGTACGVAFTAPASGRVLILNNCQVGNSGSFNSLCTIQVRAGSTIGSGTVILAAADAEAIFTNIGVRLGVSRLLQGLTPGGSYNAQQLFAVAGGTGTFSNKSLTVVPV